MAFIEAQQVRFSYEPESVDAREVLHGVDLSIEEGEFVALLGHNGCGKSTMAKLFNGMLVPTAGRVLVGGIDTRVEETQLDVRRQVGLVLQNPDNQLVAGVVEEDVAFGPENLGVPPEEIRRRVEAALKAVDMYQYREHAPHKLSGGQKQRVAIARALMRNPSILLADEPVASLDPVTGRQILCLLRDIQRQRGVSILMNSHNLDLSLEFSTHIVGMNRGRVVFDGAPGDVTEAVLRDIYGEAAAV